MSAARRTGILALPAVLAACLLSAAAAQASDGTWERAWGKDVDSGGGTGFEICTAAASCKAASGIGTLGGEVGTPEGVATDAAGNVYVADTGRDRIQKFDSSGNFERAWGRDVVTGGFTGAEVCSAAASCKAGVSGDLGGELNFPEGIATDAAGNVYVADTFNNRIQKFSASGAFQAAWGKDVLSTGGTGFEVCILAGACKTGVAGGLGGELNLPEGIATDAGGNVYVADSNNHRIQKFNSSGVFQAAWGKDVLSTGGTGFEICTTAASCKVGVSGGLGGELDRPRGTAVDAAGNVYVADSGNRRVQKFDSSGGFQRTWGKDVLTAGGTGFEICDIAASCKTGVSGGLGGELISPRGAAIDAAGNVYVADTSNSRIQRFDSSGGFQRTWGKDVDSGGGTGFEICTAAASCKAGETGGLGGELNFPEGIASAAAGTVYVADTNNDRIQKFAAPAPPPPPPPPPPGDGGGETPPEPPPSGTSDTAAADTTITKRPKNKTRRRRATFEFTSSEPGSSFGCSLDGKPFTPCTSPRTLKVTLGKHSFRVRARDAAGNVDQTPAGDKWTRKPRRETKGEGK